MTDMTADEKFEAAKAAASSIALRREYAHYIAEAESALVHALDASALPPSDPQSYRAALIEAYEVHQQLVDQLARLVGGPPPQVDGEENR